MIKRHIDVPYDTADDDKYNNSIDMIKSEIVDKYHGKEVRIVVVKCRGKK